MFLQCRRGRCVSRQNEVGLQRDEFLCGSFDQLRISSRLAYVELEVAALRPAERLKPLTKCDHVGLSHRVALGKSCHHADAPHPLALLRPCHERPAARRPTKQRDELAAPDHSITSSARTSTLAGTSRPIALAVLRLMTSSCFTGACTGRS